MKIVCCRSRQLLTVLVSARLLFNSSIRLNSRPLQMATDSATRSFNTLQIGLTGSIGMGKSTISNQFKKLGFPLFDADQEVHKLYAQNGGAVEPLHQVFPEVIVNNAVDRAKLTTRIMEDPSSLKIVESIVHPLVQEERRKFYEQACADNKLMVVYDIPLLFENIDKYQVDYIVVATADPEVQRRRVLERPGMTEDKFAAILQKQVPDSVKREKADFLVHTDFAGYSEAKSQLSKIIDTIIKRNPDLFEQWKIGDGVGLAGNTPSDIDTRSLSLSEAAKKFRSAVDLVVFDLDDTIVPVGVQLESATTAMKEFMKINMPNTLLVADKSLRDAMKEIASKHPHISHDLHEVRHRALFSLALKYGEESYVQEAMDVFLRARSDVTANYYEHTEECLEWLHHAGVKIAVLTNGSADLSMCPVLSKYLSFSFTAAEVGISKPAPVGFVACAQVAKVPPNRVMYIGDSYDFDVRGCVNAGMISVLIERKDYNNKAATPTSTFTSGECAERHRMYYPLAHIVLPTLGVKDLESAFSNYFK